MQPAIVTPLGLDRSHRRLERMRHPPRAGTVPARHQHSTAQRWPRRRGQLLRRQWRQWQQWRRKRCDTHPRLARRPPDISSAQHSGRPGAEANCSGGSGGSGSRGVESDGGGRGPGLRWRLRSLTAARWEADQSDHMQKSQRQAAAGKHARPRSREGEHARTNRVRRRSAAAALTEAAHSRCPQLSAPQDCSRIGLDEAEPVEHTQGQEDAGVALKEL